MGQKVVKNTLDPDILDKLIEETGLEREVIIAWRFVTRIILNDNLILFCFFIENNFYWHVHRVKWVEKISLDFIVHYVWNRKIKLKK